MTPALASPEPVSIEPVGTELLDTELLSAAPGHQPRDEPVPPPGRNATLLAVVPIPGTGTSLAIVGYAICASGPERGPEASGPHLGAGTGPGLLLDHLQRQVWADGREITLTFQEFELLAFLGTHPATVFSRADLVEQVWRRDAAQDRAGHGPGPSAADRRNVGRDSRTVDVHVSRLRHKLGPAYGRCLVTEYRAGYQFRPLAS